MVVMQNKLRQARDDANMSQEELAKKSGISRTTISGIENNEDIVVKTSTIIAIANALNKRAQDIFF